MAGYWGQGSCDCPHGGKSVGVGGTDHKLLQAPEPAPQKPGGCAPPPHSIPEPLLTYCRNLQGQARAHGVVPCRGLRGSRDLASGASDKPEVEPSGAHVGLLWDSERERKGTEGWTSVSRGSSLIAGALVYHAPISSRSESELKIKSNERLTKKESCV